MHPIARLSLALLAALGGCGSPGGGPPAKVAKKAAPAASPAPQGLPALTPREQALKAELEVVVRKLAGEIGERNATQKWELADAADYLAGEIEAAGYSVERQGYEVDDGAVAVQNLVGQLSGGSDGDEVIVIGAHYDTAPGSPGADDNASGVAAVLALARSLRGAQPARSIRFAFFVNEEPPFFQTPEMGSLRYAREVAAEGASLVGMISVESIGYYSDDEDSQNYPEALAARYPKTGNFLAVVGNEESTPLVSQLAASLRQHASLPIEAAALPADSKAVGWSDHWSFWQMGYSAVMITDTAPFRYPSYHQPTDTPDALDYSRMARAVAGLEAAVIDLAGIDSSSSRAGR